jgi:predicted permease
MSGLSLVLQQAVLPVFVISLAGILLRKINWLTEEADQSLLRLTINVLAPALIVDSILANHALTQPGNLLVAPLVGFGTVALGIYAALGCARWAGLKSRQTASTFALCVGIYNYGYVPVPLVNSLFHDDGTLGVLFVHNLGVDVALWTLGLHLIDATGSSKGWRKLLSPPVLAIVVAVPLNLLHADRWIPQAVLVTAKMLGQCAVPMGIILIGATIADHSHEFPAASGWPVIGWASLLRLGLLPVGFLILAKYLPCPIELKRVIVIQAAMPAAVFPIVMAKHYGGDPPTALRVVIGTSVIGLLTIPLWIRFGMGWVGVQ